jgi:hypothetical protein
MNLLDASIEVSLVPGYPTMEFAASGGVLPGTGCIVISKMETLLNLFPPLELPSSFASKEISALWDQRPNNSFSCQCSR